MAASSAADTRPQPEPGFYSGSTNDSGEVSFHYHREDRTVTGFRVRKAVGQTRVEVHGHKFAVPLSGDIFAEVRWVMDDRVEGEVFVRGVGGEKFKITDFKARRPEVAAARRTR